VENSKRQFTVLIVDDNLVNLKLLATTLDNYGYRTLTAIDGPTARKIAASEKPDLILLDIKMPGEDGFDVIRKLKKNPATSSIPVIFLSGMIELESKLTGFELGAVDYITKPFHPLEVLARVRLHLKLSIATNSLINNQADKLKQIMEAQTTMLTTPACQPNAKFGVYYRALEEAGGDFYEVLPISDDIYGYFVADFSGHDIKTSYLISSVKALLKQNCTPVYKPIESMNIINEVLIKILPEEKYLTACYASLNRRTRSMTIINAGHPPAVYQSVDGDSRFIMLDGDVLGGFDSVSFGEEEITVAPGDRIFLYSDGLVEPSQGKILWTKGSAKLLEACDAVRNEPIKTAPQQIVEKLSHDCPQCDDDVIVLGIEV